MDVFECIHTRRSIRKFLDKKVSIAKIVQIVEAGRMAPNSGNLQCYKIIVVMDEKKKNELAEACLQQYFISAAPVVLVVVAEPEKIKRHYGERGEKLYIIQDCAALTENMLLAAHALGLAGCWVGAFEDDMVRRVLNIPDNCIPQAVIPIGYPDEIVPVPPRKNFDTVVYSEGFGQRIKDIDLATGYFGGVWRRIAEEKKKEVEKKAEKLAEKIKKKAIAGFEKVKKRFRK